MKPRFSRSSHLILPVLLFFAGFLLRLIRLDDQSLSGDEAYSVVIWVQSSVKYLLGTIALATTEPHPPLALLALHGWARLVGDSVFALRMMSVLSSLITMAGAYAILRRLAGRQAAMIGLLLLAVNPFQIWYAQFARNYALWMAGSIVTILFLMRAWEKPNQIRQWIPYVLSAIVTGYVFYLEAFIFIAHNVYALYKVWRRRDWFLIWSATQMIVIAVLSPWYFRPQLWQNSQDYVPNAGPANPLWGLQTLVVGDSLPPLLQNPQIADPGHSVGIASVGVLVLIVVALVVAWRVLSRGNFILMAATTLAPITILTVLALVTGRGYFHPRYLASNSAPAIMLIAVGIAGVGSLRIAGRDVWRMAAVGLLVVVSGFGLWNLWNNPNFAKAPDWVGIMAYLDKETRETDLVIHNYPDPAFSYYFEHVYQGEAEKAELPASANPPYETLSAQLADQATGHDVVWFMPVEVPWWDGEQQVLRWLYQTKVLVDDRWFGVTRLYRFADWLPDDPHIAQRIDAQFGDVVTLDGISMHPDPAEIARETPVSIELFWRPISRTDSDLNIFVHLLAADGSLLAQADHVPQDGLSPTMIWESGVLLRDVAHLEIPVDAPPGEYVIAVGLYDPLDGSRIPVLDGGQAGSADSIIIAPISLP